MTTCYIVHPSSLQRMNYITVRHPCALHFLHSTVTMPFHICHKYKSDCRHYTGTIWDGTTAIFTIFIQLSTSDTIIFTSLAKKVMFLVAVVCLFVCLFVCGQHYSKSYERIGMKFYGTGPE